MLHYFVARMDEMREAWENIKICADKILSWNELDEK
jgi:hypothetical protein